MRKSRIEYVRPAVIQLEYPSDMAVMQVGGCKTNLGNGAAGADNCQQPQNTPTACNTNSAS